MQIDGPDGEERNERGASSHRFGSSVRQNQVPELNASDYDSEDLEEHQQRRALVRDGRRTIRSRFRLWRSRSRNESGTIKKWMTRAASFFRGGSDSAVPTQTRSRSRSRSATPTSDEDEHHASQMISGFAQRSATHQQLSSLGMQSPSRAPGSNVATSSQAFPTHRLQHHLSIPSATANASSSPSTTTSSARSGSNPHSARTSPKVLAQRLRAHVLQGRFRGTDVTANPQPILRMASSGLPRTLSQLELVSDLSSMP